MPTLTAVRVINDGPTDVELEAIETRSPIVQAEVVLLDVEISLLDAPASPWSERRLRHAHRELFAARLKVAHRVVMPGEVA